MANGDAQFEVVLDGPGVRSGRISLAALSLLGDSVQTAVTRIARVLDGSERKRRRRKKGEVRVRVPVASLDLVGIGRGSVRLELAPSADVYPELTVLPRTAVKDAGIDLAEERMQIRSGKADIIMIPIRPIPNTWADEKLQVIAKGGVLHQFLLPPDATCDWEGGYADLWWMVTYRLSDLMQRHEKLSLSDSLRDGLGLQLANFFTFRETPANTEDQPREITPC